MENQQPIKQKDLTLKYFKDEVARNSGHEAWNDQFRHCDKDIHDAWKLYSDYLVQQAKHAGFIEGISKLDNAAEDIKAALKIHIDNTCCEQDEYRQERATGKYRGLEDALDIIESHIVASPYEPREKGGEDGV